MRVLLLVLASQAAILTSLIGRCDQQVWGSLIWLTLYCLLLIPQKVLDGQIKDSILSDQPAKISRLDLIIFEGRRSALAFVVTLLMSPGKSGRWNWLDPFMPNNERRTNWEIELQSAGLFRDAAALEAGAHISGDTKRILEQVRRARDILDFRKRMKNLKGWSELVLIDGWYMCNYERNSK